jgi:hypothetical protein
MLDFLIIFAAALSGFVHAPVWVVVVAAGGLFAMSYWRHADIYERGLGLGLVGLMRSISLSSGLNAIVACATAFGGGILVRLVSGS